MRLADGTCWRAPLRHVDFLLLLPVAIAVRRRLGFRSVWAKRSLAGKKEQIYTEGDGGGWHAVV